MEKLRGYFPLNNKVRHWHLKLLRKYGEPSEFRHLSDAEKKTVLNACYWKPFKHWQVWLASLAIGILPVFGTIFVFVFSIYVSSSSLWLVYDLSAIVIMFLTICKAIDKFGHLYSFYVRLYLVDSIK